MNAPYVVCSRCYLVVFRIVLKRPLMTYIKLNWSAYLPTHAVHLEVRVLISELTRFAYAQAGRLLVQVDAIFTVKLGSCYRTHFFADKMSQISYVQLASEEIAINVSLCITPGAKFWQCYFIFVKPTVCRRFVGRDRDLDAQHEVALSVAFFVILLYDHVLTFGEEVSLATFVNSNVIWIFSWQVEYIWKQNMNVVSSLAVI